MDSTIIKSTVNDFEFLNEIDFLDCYTENSLDFERFFYKLNKQIGIRVSYPNFDLENFLPQIETQFDCKKFYLSQNYNGSKRIYNSHYFYFLRKDVIIVIGNRFVGIELYHTHNTDNEFLNEVRKVFENPKWLRKTQQLIGLITMIKSELEIQYFPIDKVRLDLNLNYNDDFLSVHHTIYSRLKKRKEKGLVLLHGKPGTGKTNYIRYLINHLKKEIIFLPSNYAEVVTTPAFLNFLIQRANSILVIEDAENIIMQRSGERNIAIANLLNLCDGMLSDCLNIQVICTFNNDISKIDQALLRKGRLIAEYEFKPLQLDKAQRLSNSLGFNTTAKSSMTLAEIYNQGDKNASNTNKVLIGFLREN